MAGPRQAAALPCQGHVSPPLGPIRTSNVPAPSWGAFNYICASFQGCLSFWNLFELISRKGQSSISDGGKIARYPPGRLALVTNIYRLFSNHASGGSGADGRVRGARVPVHCPDHCGHCISGLKEEGLERQVPGRGDPRELVGGLGRWPHWLPPSLQAEAAVAAVAVADTVRDGPPSVGPDGMLKTWAPGGACSAALVTPAPGTPVGGSTGPSAAASFFLRYVLLGRGLGLAWGRRGREQREGPGDLASGPGDLASGPGGLLLSGAERSSQLAGGPASQAPR